MEQRLAKVNSINKIIPRVLQIILNAGLTILAFVLSILLLMEIVEFINILFSTSKKDYKLILANILIFFLYFEFITMIVKYFKEDYHFPLRYFMYIGITAMIRLIIVEHDHPVDTLVYSLVIFVLIISYYIINITPRERPNNKNYK
ncbi:phosphate-starvation-inducible protein PsiE [Solibacillus sp. FSL R7-0682]|uniref:phosphate-starvation-inducible protein PsiE n=1 Tax=Solibacillus sp. FSL R7-0682 TaxID=2921690 RepID=UPI0030F7F32D